MGIFLVIAAALLAAFIFYWQLVVAEGAYLGRRVVVLLYDWFAPRYDKVKQFQPTLDTIMLAMPILRHLAGRQTIHGNSQPAILDVATGTGRLPQTLLAQRHFRGHIVALDLSSGMLAQAKAKLNAQTDRMTWVHHDAQQLPFDANQFDVVTCLEALEFFPNPQKAIGEMMRVLKPGGLLMLTNRIGPDAWKLPGRVIPTPQFAAWLAHLGLRQVEVDRWLADYDLVRAIK